MPNVLFIRADGSSGMGTGHVMRCLALAQAWVRDGGQVVWAQAETTPALTARLQAEGCTCLAVAAAAGTPGDTGAVVEHARKLQAAWIVADGYAFGATWQKQIKDAGFRLLVIDDYGHAEHYHADLILNQNAAADEKLYAARRSTTRMLLGTSYTLLRREFLASRGAARQVAAVARKLLVTLGGGDADNVTGKVIEALVQLSEIETVVVVGGSNPHLAAIRERVANAGAIRVVVNATNMPELMAWADVAISAAGSTSWELAYMGLPSLLVVTADNQTGIAEALGREGISVNLGSHAGLETGRIADAVRGLLADGSRRREMSRKGLRLVDGFGVDRVLNAMGGAN